MRSNSRTPSSRMGSLAQPKGCSAARPPSSYRRQNCHCAREFGVSSVTHMRSHRRSHLLGKREPVICIRDLSAIRRSDHAKAVVINGSWQGDRAPLSGGRPPKPYIRDNGRNRPKSVIGRLLSHSRKQTFAVLLHRQDCGQSGSPPTTVNLWVHALVHAEGPAPNPAICRIACGPSICAILERSHARACAPGISKCVARLH